MGLIQEMLKCITLPEMQLKINKGSGKCLNVNLTMLDEMKIKKKITVPALDVCCDLRPTWQN